MEIDDLPVVGKLNHTLNVLFINFGLLGLVALTLGIVIPFFPQVLDVLMAALLIVTAVIFFNIAYNIRKYKNKYLNFFK